MFCNKSDCLFIACIKLSTIFYMLTENLSLYPLTFSSQPTPISCYPLYISLTNPSRPYPHLPLTTLFLLSTFHFTHQLYSAYWAHLPNLFPDAKPTYHNLSSSSQSFFTNLTSLPAIQRVYFTDKPSSAFCPLTYTLSLMSTLHVTVWPIAKKYSVSVAAIHRDICTLNGPKVLMSYKQKWYTYPIGFVHLKVAEQTAKKGVPGLSGQYLSCMFLRPLLNEQTQLHTKILLIIHNLWSITKVHSKCKFTDE